MSFPPSAFPPQYPDEEEYTIPTNAFIGSIKLERDVVLETAIDNPAVVDQEALLSAWQELSTASVEAAIAGRPDILDFANNDCILFAAIRAPVRVVLPASVELSKLGLPDHTAVVWTDSPILPQDSVSFNRILASLDEPYLQRADPEFSPYTPSEPTPRFLGASASSRVNAQPHFAGGDHNLADGNGESVFLTPETPAVLSPRTIGIVYVTMSPVPRQVHIGIALLPDYRGYGAGLRAAAAATQWAIDAIGAHRVQARVLSGSPCGPRARRLFAALGFAHEGVQRRAVTDAAGAWADVTHMGVVDTEWVVRRRADAAPRSLWDELFERHQREREELLRWEERQQGLRLRRTGSMDTVRGGEDIDMAPTDVEDSCSESEASSVGCRTRSPSVSPSPLPSAASSEAASGSERALLSLDEILASVSGTLPPRQRWRSPDDLSSDDDLDPFSDSEWVSAALSSRSHSSEEPVSRPLSAASWSSFESVPASPGI